MTDEEACAAELDRHFDEADSYTGDEQRAFDGGFAAGLAHARQWRPLTSDPESWPEQGAYVVVSDEKDAGPHRYFRVGRMLGDDAKNMAETGWTHWLPLPSPPPTKGGGG